MVPKKTGGSCAPIVQGMEVVLVGSDIGWSVSIPIQELTAARRRWHRFCCLWLIRGDTHRLYLQDGSSKDYTWQACLCSDLAYTTVSQSSCLVWTTVSIVWLCTNLYGWAVTSYVFSTIVTCSFLLQTAGWQTFFGYMPCVLWPDTLTTGKL